MQPKALPKVHTLALAVHLACGGLAYSAVIGLPALWAAPAHAQSESASQAVVSFNIPAGPLSETLNRFAEQTGLYLSGAGELTAGKNTSGLQGEFTVAEALRRLLQGTGIDYRLTGENTVSLAAANESGNVMSLPAMTVTSDALGAITEYTGSYTTGSTNTATKFDLSPRETPQTVTIVTRQLMDDFAMTSVDDALRATSGVYIHDRGGVGSTYFSRGFELQNQYDGIPNPVGISAYNRNPQIDNAFLDRVEVLQGPSGLLSGAGDPGGTINLVRKRPTEEFQAHVEAQGGSWNQRRLVGDISGSLMKSGRVRGRLVMLMDERDSFVDHAFRDRQAVYGVIEGDITPSTRVYASLQYQEDKNNNHDGVPYAEDGSDAGLSRSAFFADANHVTTRDYTLYTLGLEQQLPADWSMKLQYAGNKTNVDKTNVSYIWGDLDASTGDGISIYQLADYDSEDSYDALDAYISGPLTLLGRNHELVLGANGSTKTRNYAGSGYMPALPINVYTFDPTALPTPVAANGYSGETKINQQGIYGVGRFSLSDSLKLITGARISWYEDKDMAAGTTTAKESSVVSPYAGLIYDINDVHSAYISYSDIFNPQSNKSEDGSTLKPVVGSNYEVGIKSEFFGGQLNTAAAVFRLEQTYLARLDASVPNDPGNACGGPCYTASDKVISQGVELSINGEIQPGWNLAAGYTYVDSEHASGADKGERYRTELPQHTVQLSSNYQLPNTDWSIGGNLQHYSKIYKEGADWKISRDALTLVGLTANYQINPSADLTLVVNNLFDETYRASLEQRNFSPFGEPRNLVANLKYRF